MQVKDHIRRSVITIHPEQTFREALDTMVQNKTNGLIVVDDVNHPVGTIDSFNLIKSMTPSYLHDDPTLAQFSPEDLFHKAVSQALNLKVGDIMDPLQGVSVTEDDPMMLAATLASKHNVRYVPVVEKDGSLAGLVSRTDIKRAMADLLNLKD